MKPTLPTQYPHNSEKGRIALGCNERLFIPVFLFFLDFWVTTERSELVPANKKDIDLETFGNKTVYLFDKQCVTRAGNDEIGNSWLVYGNKSEF